ncbi:hypothetical protein HPB49_012179 [Dermacentor silvarum]|nr:hypothetical protein HPB49_012179 [Dermacentor silvarum]
MSDLENYQRTVTPMVDETHIKAFFDYKGGGITGVAHNSTEAAISALVFMVRSLTCKFKEVAHIVPVWWRRRKLLARVAEGRHM